MSNLLINFPRKNWKFSWKPHREFESRSHCGFGLVLHQCSYEAIGFMVSAVTAVSCCRSIAEILLNWTWYCPKHFSIHLNVCVKGCQSSRLLWSSGGLLRCLPNSRCKSPRGKDCSRKRCQFRKDCTQAWNRLPNKISCALPLLLQALSQPV